MIPWEELQNLLVPEKPPVDSFTVGDLVKKFNFTRATAQRRINALIKEGKAKVWGKRPTNNAFVYYQLIKSNEGRKKVK